MCVKATFDVCNNPFPENMAEQKKLAQQIPFLAQQIPFLR